MKNVDFSISFSFGNNLKSSDIKSGRVCNNYEFESSPFHFRFDYSKLKEALKGQYFISDAEVEVAVHN